MKFYVLRLVGLAAERSDTLRNQVGISNDLASLLYSRSPAEIITSRRPSAEIITSRTLLSGDNNFTDAGPLVRCHDNEVTL
jgi:hypothetical protein